MPQGIEIPESHHGINLIGRLVTEKLVTYRDVLDWKYTWQELFDMHDMLDLKEWISWESHVKASAKNGN